MNRGRGVGGATQTGNGQLVGQTKNAQAKWHGKTFVAVGTAGAILTLPTIVLPIAFAILAKKGLKNLRLRESMQSNIELEPVEEEKQKDDTQLQTEIKQYTNTQAVKFAQQMQEACSKDNTSISTELQTIDDLDDTAVNNIIQNILEESQDFWGSKQYQALSDIKRAMPTIKIGEETFARNPSENFPKFFKRVLQSITSEEQQRIFIRQLLKYPGQAGFGTACVMYNNFLLSKQLTLQQYNQNNPSLEISFNNDGSIKITSTIDYCVVSLDEINNLQNKERQCISERITMEIEAPDNKKKSKSRYTVTKSNITCFKEKTKTTDHSKSDSIVSDTDISERKHFMEIEYDNKTQAFVIK